MSFLQPLLLMGLPLVALPIIIHLINQRRFQTVRWGAMMFLLAANRLSRGYARLRQWLIMAFRMLAIAGLIFAIARPLASGWLGITAGGFVRRHDERSRRPLSQPAGAGSGYPRRETGNGQATARAGPAHTRLGTLGSDRKHDAPAARARISRQPAQFTGDRTSQQCERYSGDAAGGA